MKVDKRRIRLRSQQPLGPGPIIYWMSRDQRVKDNWALLYAQELAITHKRPLLVMHNLVAGYLNGQTRFLWFKAQALQEVEQALQKKQIPFALFEGTDSHEACVQWAGTVQAGAVVMDMNPLRIQRQWLKQLVAQVPAPIYEVDAHNIVPVWAASPKQEYAAYTIRPKIHKLLPEFLTDIPRVKKHPHVWDGAVPHDGWPDLSQYQQFDMKPGERAAAKKLKLFIEERLDHYAEQRNDPNADALSQLSPYLHYGHLSPQRAVLEVVANHREDNNTESFIEETVVRRELSDNFCFYNPHYDSVQGFPDWARQTLDEHRDDPREYVYTYEEFEQAQTHDPLWNAAQMQMVRSGKMHGYMRMYWAKKILEWTNTPETALRFTIKLNDTYELDGRDSNGYVGAAWSIGGVHDRAWTERPIFGKIRYMNDNGCKRKFDVPGYIEAQSQQSLL